MGATELARAAGELLTLPEVYLRARRVLQSADSSMAEMADVIACDPAMTARLLRIANSAFFGFAARVQTVARAINILGTQQVHDLLLATAVADAFAGVPASVVDLRAFWRRSVYCGAAARLLAARCNVLDSERLFVEGLLHDIGHLVMYQQVPEQAAAALQVAREEGLPVHAAERAMLGYDAAAVGAELLRLWHLPSGMQESVRFHPEPERAEAFALETAIVHLAWCLTASGGDPEQAAPRVVPVAWQCTRLSADCLEAVATQAARSCEEVAALVCPDPRDAA